MTEPIERIRQIVGQHRRDDRNDGVCGCGATGVSDHAAHVADEIVARLGLRRERVENRIRYVSAWLDDELTQLEGAE